ncbi:hypothetical protein BV22DRAFT_69562 [Leucogyrophana mollusca]|uniref:Uncharacterized protein n=1 Tax=Leucogyrophana mollusca TaxID=85980 RepID=A0ACB8BXZ4_9AGAM|nr:hypothetical protein BV22DRAFT_69562 [Leucogyrophana mollusca]
MVPAPATCPLPPFKLHQIPIGKLVQMTLDARYRTACASRLCSASRIFVLWEIIEACCRTRIGSVCGPRRKHARDSKLHKDLFTGPHCLGFRVCCHHGLIVGHSSCKRVCIQQLFSCIKIILTGTPPVRA